MLEIHAQWDEDARVWYAVSNAVPGLCVQAPTFDDLVKIATDLAPELLEANHEVYRCLPLSSLVYWTNIG